MGELMGAGDDTRIGQRPLDCVGPCERAQLLATASDRSDSVDDDLDFYDRALLAALSAGHALMTADAFFDLLFAAERACLEDSVAARLALKTACANARAVLVRGPRTWSEVATMASPPRDRITRDVWDATMNVARLIMAEDDARRHVEEIYGPQPPPDDSEPR